MNRMVRMRLVPTAEPDMTRVSLEVAFEAPGVSLVRDDRGSHVTVTEGDAEITLSLPTDEGLEAFCEQVAQLPATLRSGGTDGV